MTLTPFDGSEYRRTVLTPLRAAAPSAVDDVFWLAHLPRATDDSALIAGRLKETKAFLHKERARPRQADVAAAVLKEWPRVVGVLTDAGARRSLRTRLGSEAPGGAAAAAGGSAARPGAGAGTRTADPAARRRGQVAAALGDLARLREEPELAEDLFSFLGLPFTATTDMLRARLERIADLNRKRRPDRERSLVDELVMHARELLVEGDPVAYRAGLAADAAPSAEQTVAPGVEASLPPSAVPPKIDTTRRPRRAAPPARAEPAPSAALVAPAATTVEAVREPGGAVVVTWIWPPGVTEAFLAVGEGATPAAPGPGGRKVTNMKYDLDRGARLDGVPAGAVVAVHTGRRDQAGTLTWNAPEHGRETIVP